MQAAQFTAHGEHECRGYLEFDDPDIDRGEILADVTAGALNHLDVFRREGLAALDRVDLAMPHIRGGGGDAADPVEEVGTAVERLDVCGRVVTCGATRGRHPETDINLSFWTRLEVIGSTIGTPGEMDDVLGLDSERASSPSSAIRFP